MTTAEVAARYGIPASDADTALLGQAAMQGGLAAFEAQLAVASGLITLVAVTGSDATPRTRSATDDLPALDRPGGRLEIV